MTTRRSYDIRVVNWFHFSKFRIVRNMAVSEKLERVVVNWFHFSKFRIVRNKDNARAACALVVNWFHFSKFRIVRNIMLVTFLI